MTPPRSPRVGRNDVTFLPPHEPTAVPGFHAYGGEMRIRPGQSLSLHVSNDGPVKVEIVRLGRSYSDALAVASLDEVDTLLRPVHRGSYVHVDEAPILGDAFSAEVWCRPLTSGSLRGLIDHPVFTLSLDDHNAAVFHMGEAKLRSQPVPIEQWHHVVATFDGTRVVLFVDGEQADHASAAVRTDHAGVLRLGALHNDAQQTANLFTGDMFAPAVYSRALSPQTIRRRFRTKSLRPATGCVAHWAFDALKRAAYRDTTRGKRHGRPVNYPIRMIPGPRRTIDSDWCAYDPTADPDFGHAVRLMADAIVDCRWPQTTSWTAPRNIEPGQYAARITNANNETRHVPFIIRPSRPRPGVKLLCLSTTNTRIAYNFQPFGMKELDYGAYQHHPNYPLLGQLHGAHRPTTGEPWERTTVEFELPFYAWLDEVGIAYDVYSEWDIEADPSLVEHYDVVAIAGHSEYWTIKQHETLRRHLQRGKHLLSMSGNTAYWRVSIDATNQVMEVRKHDHRQMPGVNCHPMVFSAHHHQMDHLPGSCMRYAGYPEGSLLGLASGGFTDPPLSGPRAGYRVLRPDHALFHHPHKIDTTEPFANNAAGYETDCAIRLMLERYGPSKAPMYPAADGSARPTLESTFDQHMTILARTAIPRSDCLDYDVNFFKGDMSSDIAVIERPGEGLAVAIASVLSSHVLHDDQNFAKFVLNVLQRMGIQVKE